MLRVAIAGYGTVGKIRHQCIDGYPDAQVVAVADSNLNTGQISEGIWGFTDSHVMLETVKPDVLFIALPNYLSGKLTIDALQHGSHVFCEKPPARNLIELNKVLEAEIRNPGLHLTYGFNHRFHPSVKMALELVESGQLGDLIDMRGVYGKSAIIRYNSSEWRCQRDLAGGGILLDQGIHMVDMMRLMAGDFEEIHSFVSNSHWRHDVEDNAYAIMRTGAGVVAMIHSSATQWRHRFQLDITLTKGSITLTGILSSTRSYGAETITVATSTPDLLGEPNEVTTRFSSDTSWQEETSDFLHSVHSGINPTSSSSQHALKTMEVVYAIYDADPVWFAKYGTDWSTSQAGK
jgi:predicted dehydrogenase